MGGGEREREMGGWFFLGKKSKLKTRCIEEIFYKITLRSITSTINLKNKGKQKKNRIAVSLTKNSWLI